MLFLPIILTDACSSYTVFGEKVILPYSM